MLGARDPVFDSGGGGTWGTQQPIAWNIIAVGSGVRGGDEEGRC